MFEKLYKLNVYVHLENTGASDISRWKARGRKIDL